MASRIETGLQITGLSGDTNALYVVGNSLVNGDVSITGNVNVIGTATTLNTETVQTRDNRILLNYSGTSLSAIGGGIEVLSAKTDGSNTSLKTDINSDWNMNVGLNITGRTNDSSSYGLKVKNSGGTDNMVVRNDGNVGIGITSPTAKLHLVGSTDTSSSNSLYISDSASTATFILRDDGGLIVGKNANTSLGNSNSLTIGSQSLATGTNSVAVGHLASASGTESTSFGKQTISSNDGTTSIGSNSTASGQQSVAIGRASTASSTESIAIGRLNTSSNTGAITIGSQSQSTGTRSEVIGSFSFSKSDYSTSIGSFININTGLTGANVIGYGLTSGGGQELSATTSNSLALGWNSTTPSFLFSKSSDSYLNGSGNIGIGTTTPTAKLHISGGTTGTTQYTLKLDDSSGNANLWVRDDGVVFYGQAGFGTTRKFISAGPANDSFVSVGYDVLNNYVQNTTGGNGAVGFGLKVLTSLPSGGDGTAFGSLVFNGTSLTGGRNVGFGRGVGSNVTTGSQNLLFGYNTAANFTTGSQNIQITHEVGGGDLSNTLAFGHNFTLSGSNSIHFGQANQYNTVYWGTDTTNGGFAGAPNFTERLMSIGNGIGLFNWNGKNWIFEGSRSTGQGTGGSFIWRTTPSGVTSADTQNTLVEAMRITGEGNIGIGTSSPSSKLQVSGRTITTNFTMTSGATNGYVLTSDATGNASWSPSTGGGSFTGGTVTGATIFTGGVSANTISATTYQSTISNTQVVYSNNGTLTGSTAMTWTNSATTLSITGTLEATSKSFVIPHPTKEGKKLVYGSLEGPENGVYHRGKLTNENTILLPEYWSKLVDKNTVTVNLTPIGRFQNLYVKEVLSDKIIVDIESGLFGNKTIECYYTVYGERKDTDKLVIER